MKNTGIIRKLDIFGRLCIPKELRKTFDADKKCKMEITMSGRCVIIKKQDVNTVGLVREFDANGRLCIPKETRELLDIRSGDNLEILVNEENGICLRKCENKVCVFCGNTTDNMVEFKEHYICAECKNELSKLN
jgi:transcriptional pleiotropic regulator of transition state genes